MEKLYTRVDQMIGKTPLLELTNLERELELGARVLAKAGIFQSRRQCEGPGGAGHAG